MPQRNTTPSGTMPSVAASQTIRHSLSAPQLWTHWTQQELTFMRCVVETSRTVHLPMDLWACSFLLLITREVVSFTATTKTVDCNVVKIVESVCVIVLVLDEYWLCVSQQRWRLVVIIWVFKIDWLWLRLHSEPKDVLYYNGFRFWLIALNLLNTERPSVLYHGESQSREEK